MNRQNKYILTIYLLANIALAFFLKENASYLSILMMCVNLSLGIIWTFSCFGLKRSLMLIVISFAVTISLENISINTGYPYGELKHALPGPMIGSVPLIIGLSYFPLITISWIFGDIIVNGASSHPHRCLSRLNSRYPIRSCLHACIQALGIPSGRRHLRSSDVKYAWLGDQFLPDSLNLRDIGKRMGEKTKSN